MANNSNKIEISMELDLNDYQENLKKSETYARDT